MNNPIYYDGKVVGVVDEENIFNTVRHEIFRRYNGFGISTNVLQQLQMMDVKTIKVTLAEIGEYVYSIDDFLNSQKVYNNDGDIQKFVTLETKPKKLQTSLDEYL